MKAVPLILVFGSNRTTSVPNLRVVVRKVLASTLIGLTFLFSTARALPADCVSPPSDLVAWWPGQLNGNDIVGTNHGTLYNGASFAPGQVGQAFSFDGTNDMVQVPNSPALNFGPNTAMTVELWAYRTSANPVAHLVGKRVGCADAPYINYEIVYDAVYGLQFNSGTGIGALTRTQLPMLTWTHLAGTFAGGTYKFYINGQLAATASGTPLGPTNSAPLKIGGTGDCQTFGGLLDEVTIYSRALSAGEIAAIYNAGSAGKCEGPYIKVQPRNQLGYWGKSVTFTVTAVALGPAPLYYQWQKEGVPINGATSSSLALTNLQMMDAGNYSVVITNSLGSITSGNAYLTMNPAGVSIALYPGVTIDGVPGLTYGIEYTTDLSNTNSWRGLVNVPLSAPSMLWFDVYPAMTQPQRYYRVVPGPIPIP